METKQTIKQRKKARQAFTLVEVIVGGALTLLLFLGAINLYIASAQIAVQSGAACYATTDAANAVQRIVQDAEESHWLALPEEAGWTSPGGETIAAFQTTVGGSLVDTGVELVSPSPTSLMVQGRSGSPLSASAYDRSPVFAPPSTLWIYRSNGDGTPNAAAGQYLWMRGTEQGQPVNRALVASLSPTSASAVQFRRPSDASSSSQFPYQLEIRLVSAYYASLRGKQSSELTTVDQGIPVIGKCVLLRDHEMNLDHEPNPTVSYSGASAPWRSD